MSSQQQGQGGEAEKNIEIWKVKKLIKRLESARGNGTSMISLIIRTSLHSMLIIWALWHMKKKGPYPR